MAKRIVVLGNGIAGITAARQIRKRSNDSITVISKESDHFFSRTALMYVYMGHLTYEQTKPYEDDFWRRNRIELMRAWVEQIDPERRRLEIRDGEPLEYDVLVLATGSRSNKFGWPGEDLPGVQGLYSLQDLERMERDTGNIGRAVVVGGGLIGVETAEMLGSRGIPTTFLVREPNWMSFAFPAEESTMIGRHILDHGIDVRFATELERIEPGANGRVSRVVTTAGEKIEAGFVALTVGVSPNIGFLDGSGIECDRGVLVDAQLKTSVPGVFAIGDCAQLREPAAGRRPVEPLWYTGRAMGQTVARTICGEPTEYAQGIWFNSAKFFDLEWQVYGQLPAQLPEGESEIFWQHPHEPKAIRIRYRTEDESVRAFNLIGIRYRHETCHRWIDERRPLRHVLENLGAANFDPELYREYESELVACYNRSHPDRPLRLRLRRGLSGWVRLLRRSAAAGSGT